MGQKIDIAPSGPVVEPVPAPTIWFTAVEKVRVANGVVHLLLVDEQPRADGFGVDRVVVARLKTPFDITQNNLSAVATAVMTAYRQTPEGRRAAMD